MFQVSPNWQLVFQRAFEHRQATGEWPTAVELQREFASTHPDIRVREIVAEARNYAGINAPDDRVQLTLRALLVVPEARPVLEAYLLAVRAMIKRFQDRSIAPRYSLSDLPDLHLDPGVEADLGWLLELDRWPFGSGTGSGPDRRPWEYEIDDRVMAAANVKSVEEFVALRYGEQYVPDATIPTPEPLTSSPDKQPAVSPDQPISRPEDDLLGRLPLSRALALQAVKQPHSEGFVMGISGAWGSGKSSLLNLMNAAIDATGGAYVLRFDPWMFSSSEELVMRFLREMSTQMTHEPKLKTVAAQVAGYAEVLAPLAVLAPAPWLSPVLAASGRASRLRRKKKDSPSALKQRDNVRKALLELNERLIVIIDDLDRLQAQELRDVVRLVKLVGDFPNTTYVLAYDQPRVAAALANGEEEGNEFLEKIIQLSHDVPPPPQGSLERALVRTISDAVGDLSNYHFSQDAYNGIFATGVRDLFTTVRDIRRYGNALPVTLDMVRDEIELTDILALEALRVRTPKSFALLTASKDVMTETGSGPFASRGPAATQAQQQVFAIVQAADGFASEVEAILRRLFPAIDRHFGGGVTWGSEWLSVWRRDHRVAHPDIFDIYLNRALPEGTLPTPLVVSALAQFEDAAGLNALLKGLEPDQLEALLERLEDFEDRFPAERTDIPVSALYNQRHRLRTEPHHVFDIAAGHRVGRVVLRILRRLSTDDAEVSTERALTQIGALSDRADLVGLVGHRAGVGSGLVSEQAAQRMEESTVNETLTAPPGELAHEPDLLPLLFTAQQTRPQDFSARITDLEKDDEFLLRLLRAAVTSVVSQPLTGGTAVTSYQLNWQALTQIVRKDALVARLRGLLADVDSASLDERTQVAIELASEHL